MIKHKAPMENMSCCSSSKAQVRSVVHLPVAPQLSARTRFSPPPPGVEKCLSIGEALEMLNRRMDAGASEISMAAITGPGDPLATPEKTFAMIAAIRNGYPDLSIGLLTLGIGSSRLAGDLAKAGVDHVQMQVEGTRMAVLLRLYAWIRPGAKTLKLADAAALLLQEQRNGVSALKFRNRTVSILTTLYPGYNIEQVPLISREMAELGADTISLVPYIPHPGAEVNLESPPQDVVDTAIAQAGISLPVIPSLLQPMAGDWAKSFNSHEGGDACSDEYMAKPTKKRPNVAVASSNGMDVDLHLGHAIRFLIYGPRDDGLACLLETREAPEPGAGRKRWEQVADILKDCCILLCASAGEKPRTILAEGELRVFMTEDTVEGLVDALYGGGKKKK